MIIDVILRHQFIQKSLPGPIQFLSEKSFVNYSLNSKMNSFLFVIAALLFVSLSSLTVNGVPVSNGAQLGLVGGKHNNQFNK